MTVHEALTEAIRTLRDAGIEDARLDAEVLLSELLQQPRAWLLAHEDALLTTEQERHYRHWIARRAQGEPVAYIIGYRWFYGLKIRVTPDVLIPRPETEHLVELALEDLRARPNLHHPIVDVGTGSGAIAVAIARHEPRAVIVATDISPRALRVARHNAHLHGVAGRTFFVCADLLTPLVGPFDLIVANLPYVGFGEAEDLAPDVRRYEPPEALWAGANGLALIQRLLQQAPHQLSPKGILLLEVGYRQAHTVAQMAAQALPDARVTIYRDLAGHERIVSVRKSLHSPGGKKRI